MKKTKRVSTKKLKSWIKEEREATKMYHSYGFHGIEKQEAGHARTLLKELKRRMKK